MVDGEQRIQDDIAERIEAALGRVNGLDGISSFLWLVPVLLGEARPDEIRQISETIDRSNGILREHHRFDSLVKYHALMLQKVFKLEGMNIDAMLVEHSVVNASVRGEGGRQEVKVNTGLVIFLDRIAALFAYLRYETAIDPTQRRAAVQAYLRSLHSIFVGRGTSIIDSFTEDKQRMSAQRALFESMIVFFATRLVVAHELGHIKLAREPTIRQSASENVADVFSSAWREELDADAHAVRSALTMLQESHKTGTLKLDKPALAYEGFLFACVAFFCVMSFLEILHDQAEKSPLHGSKSKRSHPPAHLRIQNIRAATAAYWTDQVDAMVSVAEEIIALAADSRFRKTLLETQDLDDQSGTPADLWYLRPEQHRRELHRRMEEVTKKGTLDIEAILAVVEAAMFYADGGSETAEMVEPGLWLLRALRENSTDDAMSVFLAEGIARILIRGGREDEALHYLREIVALKEDEYALTNLLRIYDNTGQREAARDIADRICRLDMGAGETLATVASFLVRDGNEAVALRLLERYPESLKDDEYLLYLHRRCLGARDLRARIEEFVEAHPTPATPLEIYIPGVLYSVIHDSRSARSAAQIALEMADEMSHESQSPGVSACIVEMKEKAGLFLQRLSQASADGKMRLDAMPDISSFWQFSCEQNVMDRNRVLSELRIVNAMEALLGSMEPMLVNMHRW